MLEVKAAVAPVSLPSGFVLRHSGPGLWDRGFRPLGPRLSTFGNPAPLHGITVWTYRILIFFYVHKNAFFQNIYRICDNHQS